MTFIDQIAKPTLLLNEVVTRKNIADMVNKAAKSNVILRPHFKTHQSAVIGEWFRDAGVSHITVSSVDMAQYFAAHGWNDITIAFPVNIRQLPSLSELAEKVNLNLLVENELTAQTLIENLPHPVNVWLEIDAGYARTGLLWNDLDQITAVSTLIQTSPTLNLEGLLLHAGNTYQAKGKTAVIATHKQSMERVHHAQNHLHQQGIATKISIGDTPTCSIADSFSGIDEIRPGNFVFYDVMQAEIGSCSLEQVSVAVACPVVAKYPERNCIAIYGGAIHHSKERLMRKDSEVSYGRIALPTENAWQILSDDNYVYSLSQEHGLVKAAPSLLENINVGDLLLVLPVHSCLTANLLKSYMKLDGTIIKMADIH